jgi:crossover junction endodeoxyribonuclease RusA
VIVVLPFPPSELSGHANGNSFRAKASLTAKWRGWAKQAALEHPRPVFGEGKPYTPEGDIHLTIRFFPPNKRSDRMNFANRVKPVADGLAEAWEVNDARFVPHFEYHAPEMPGRIEITIGERR